MASVEFSFWTSDDYSVAAGLYGPEGFFRELIGWCFPNYVECGLRSRFSFRHVHTSLCGLPV
jgi:hypothetical protein